MGTLKTCIDNARIRIRDSNKLFFETNDELISIVNGIIDETYSTLVNINSLLVIGKGSVTTTSGTQEYTPSFSHDGFVPDGSWVDGYPYYLQEMNEADKLKYDANYYNAPPEAFYISHFGKIGYLPIPDDKYTIYHYYYKPRIAMSDYDNDDLPFDGVFDNYIEKKLVTELLIIMERDAGREAVLAQQAWDRAMTIAYKHSLRRVKQVSDMFSVPGI